MVMSYVVFTVSGTKLCLAYVTSLRVEGKQTHILCKPKKISKQKMRQRATKYFTLLLLLTDLRRTDSPRLQCTVCVLLVLLTVTLAQQAVVVSYFS
jgi:hypothetical protein